MSQSKWTAVDDYFCELLQAPDKTLDATLAANSAAGLPAIDVSANQGQLLSMLARMSGARRILEVGTLGGYSTIWLARALSDAGHVVTLELSAKHAEVARKNLENAGVGDRVDVLVGPALETLDALANEAKEASASGHAAGGGAVAPPFDFVFIDADKSNYPGYLQAVLRLSRPGTVIVADNVVRDGEVVNAKSDDPNVIGVRAFSELLAKEPRLIATAVQTVGSKGYDGFAIAIVTQ